MPKGSFKSESIKEVLLLQKNIPNLYPKLLHPVHGMAGSQCVPGFSIIDGPHSIMKTQLGR